MIMAFVVKRDCRFAKNILMNMINNDVQNLEMMLNDKTIDVSKLLQKVLFGDFNESDFEKNVKLYRMSVEFLVKNNINIENALDLLISDVHKSMRLDNHLDYNLLYMVNSKKELLAVR